MPKVDSIISVKCSELPRDLFTEVVAQEVTLSFQLFQLFALCFIINWASDQDNHIAAVVVAIVGKILLIWGSDLNYTGIIF